MIAVIFEVWPAEGRTERYLDLARLLRADLEKVDGFLSVERFESLAEPGKLLSLSFFRDEESVRTWRNLPRHRATQATGRNGIFTDYRLRVANVVRDYGLLERDEAPSDSCVHHSEARVSATKIIVPWRIRSDHHYRPWPASVLADRGICPGSVAKTSSGITTDAPIAQVEVSSMFAIGQTVYHKTSKYSGIVQECGAETTYIMQENGVEVDFPTHDLTAVPPVAKADAATIIRALTMNDIGPEHQKVLSIIPMRTVQAVAALWERQAGKGRFSALNTAEKLNYIAKVTDISYLVMRQHVGEPSHLGLLMSRGIADRSAVGRAR